MTFWIFASIAYCSIASISFIWVLIAVFRKVDLHPGGPSFDQCPHFSEDNKILLSNSYDRMHGTLIFWKNQSEKFRRFHYYSLIWTIPSSILIPILTQNLNDANGSKTFLTIISAFTAILIAFHRGLKVEENYKGFRNGESEFYDTYRRLLDRPESFGTDERNQIRTYFEEVEKIRKFVRNTETNNMPTISEKSRKN